MKISAFTLFSAAALLASGCGEESGDPMAVPSGSAMPVGPGSSVGPVGPEGVGAAPNMPVGPQAPPACPTQMDEDGNWLIVANEANNYAFTSTLSIDVVTVAPGELTFDWSNVTTDFLGHPVDPAADIDVVLMTLWGLTQSELEMKMNSDDLSQADTKAIGALFTEGMVTSTGLYDFTSAVGHPLEEEILDGYIDPVAYPPDEHSYTVLIQTGIPLGENARMVQSFRLDPNSTNRHVELTSNSTTLDYTANLRSHLWTGVPVGNPNITIEWGNMTTNALGNDFVPTDIWSALVAKYDETPEELEDKFLDLELIHEGMWRSDIEVGTSGTLSEFTDDAGNAFPGIDDTGTWVVALICGPCANPAPWYMSVVASCAAQ